MKSLRFPQEFISYLFHPMTNILSLWSRHTLERNWSISEPRCVQYQDHRKLSSEHFLCFVIYNYHVSAIYINLQLLFAGSVSNHGNHSSRSF